MSAADVPAAAEGEGARAIHALDAGHIRAHLLFSFFALLVGGLYGLPQALDKAGIDLYQYLPGAFGSYYMGLTLHGVALALLFTFSFINGFLAFVTVHGLKRPLVSRRLGWLSFWLLAAGSLTALVPIIQNQSSVLWTFYAPLRGHPAFYIGLALVVVASWLSALNSYLSWRAWKRDNPKERTPLMTFAALVTWTMWLIASLGIAVSVLFYLLPWSLGWRETVNAFLTRSLYWYSGHPIVYFWLLPAYIAWYTMLPAQVGGRLFSESLARLVFLLFIPFAVPTGFHHMYADPGLMSSIKLLHGALTFVVVLPSLITAFTVLASIEDGARRNGGRGWIGWIFRLPWFHDPSVAGQLLAMLMFAGGGITGIVNASYSMNMVIHNSLWVVGHFHFQVGTAVTLTFMAVSYWLIPFLTGRALWSRRLALVQVWTWFLGMATMGRGMNWMGLGGAPRRTFLTYAPYADFEVWNTAGLITSAGGILLALSGALFLLNIGVTVLRRGESAGVMQVPESKPMFEVKSMPLILDRLTPWVVVTLVLVAVAWIPSLYRIAADYPMVPGWRLW